MPLDTRGRTFCGSCSCSWKTNKQTYFCHFQTSFWETGRKRMCLVMMTDFVCVSRPAPEIALMFTLMALSISMVTSFSMLISWLDRFSSCFLTWWTFLKKQKKAKRQHSSREELGSRPSCPLACHYLIHSSLLEMKRRYFIAHSSVNRVLALLAWRTNFCL